MIAVFLFWAGWTMSYSVCSRHLHVCVGALPTNVLAWLPTRTVPGIPGHTATTCHYYARVLPHALLIPCCSSSAAVLLHVRHLWV